MHGRNDQARFTLAGKYLTTGQDAQKSIVTDDVLLQRIPSQDNGTSQHLVNSANEMHSGIEAIEDKDRDNVISELLANFQNQSAG